MEEIWKDIEGYQGLYQVSNLGRLKALDRTTIKSNGVSITFKGKILKPLISKGYYMFTLSKNGKKKTLKLHRLIANAFIPNPDEKRTINHKNGIKTDNSIENLEWATYSENNYHAYKIGLKFQKGFKGEKNGQSKLTDNKVIEVKKLLKLKVPQRKIAKLFEISQSVVSKINKGESWKHI